MKPKRIVLSGVFFLLTALSAAPVLPEIVVAQTLPYEVAVLAEENRLLAENYFKDSEGLSELLWACVESLTVAREDDFSDPFFAALLEHLKTDGRQKSPQNAKIVQLNQVNEKLFLRFNDYQMTIFYFREFASGVIMKNMFLKSFASAGVFYSESEYVLWRERLVVEKGKIHSVIFLSERIRKEANDLLGAETPRTDPPAKVSQTGN